jgi:hypothetical protein
MKILFIETRFTYVGHSKSLYNNITQYVTNHEFCEIEKLECFNTDNLLNQLIDILSTNKINFIFIDWIHEYVNFYNLIDEIANKLDIRVFGITNLSFFRIPPSSENSKLSEDFQFLRKFSSINFVTYDYLLKDLHDLSINFYGLTDFTPYISFEKNSDCKFCVGQIRFDSKPVIAILGNLSRRRNLVFFNDFFNHFNSDFNFYIKGNLVNPLDLYMFAKESNGLYFSGIRFRELTDLYHIVHHLDYLLYDSERSPEPSGIADLFLAYGKGVLIPNESYSFLNDLHVKSPELPIIKIDLKRDLSNLNLMKIGAIHNTNNSNSFKDFSNSFDKIISS